jgi:TonB-dependent starch-binding outer membrane protein SusC
MQGRGKFFASAGIIQRSFLLAVFVLFVSAALSQTVSLRLKNVPLEKAFREIEKEVAQRFVYTSEMLADTRRVSINVSNEALPKVLDILFANQPLSYVLDEHFIKVRYKQALENTGVPTINVQGRVYGENNEGIGGATVRAVKSRLAAATDAAGNFELKAVIADDQLVVSSVGHTERTIAIEGKTNFNIALQVQYNQLDETIVMAYGTTTKRLNTGNISKVSSEEIARQPVSNPLTTLQGRAPGVIISQTNGYGSGAVDIQIRGQSSILQGSQPLFVIDGVPFAAQNNRLNQVANASISGISPFYTINPADIESIEILKDADATAIYGSRGANGVVLITTKRGKPGKTKVSANAYTSWSRVTRTMDMLNTSQYVAMRKEAYANDGLVPNGAEAADILVWDTTRYTDMKKLFLGNTARSHDANVSISGGSGNTQFLVNGGYHRETTVLPTELYDYRATLHSSFNHTSNNRKLGVHLKWDYSYTRNALPGLEPTAFINRPPNMKLYDEAGGLNWEEGGTTFFSTGVGEYSNPLASLETKYTGEYQNTGSGLSVKYQVLPYLAIHLTGGLNLVIGDEIRTNPSASLDPYDNNQKAQSLFGTSHHKTWIAEPQLEYKQKTKLGTITVLAGATWQENERKGVNVMATNYASDLLLHSIAGAGNVQTSNSYSQYRYNAVFGRLNYNWNDKYLINFSGRRDGSSRFGPEQQFSNFGAVGAAWIFSNEALFKERLKWVSFGKLRGSYGSTGNDAIGDYQFLDTWNTSTSSYQGVAALLPSALYNPELAWELNKKMEGALELGFWKQRILVSASYFKNRSGNQLIQYNLPIQAGFATIVMNLDAVVENKGYEVTLEYRSKPGRKFGWMVNGNMTAAENKLVRFPGLATSSYATRFVEGEPLSVQRLYQYTGVDPLTGMYTLLDVDRNGSFNASERVALRNRQPRLYGGLGNNFSYKNFGLSIFLQFVQQEGLNYLNTIGSLAPGNPFTNQPDIVLKRWQQSGDASTIQKFTTQYADVLSYLITSDAIYGDASFIRCKNVSVSYTLPERWMKKIGGEQARLYVNGQNLFTITDYEGGDPETQNIYRMPPLKTIAAGIQFSF